MEPKDPDAPIDPYSEYDLYDVLEGEIPAGESTEYEGLHLISGGPSITVQPDGHVGSVGTIRPDEYDDVLEIVDELNSYVSLWREHSRGDDDEALIEWAGPWMTSDESKADDDRYMVVPDDPASI
ncbi:hypothetical protein [Natrinema ejinorense]|uniref:Uncharacterized protein n=1 Tax=Natrinema ejinorense TaxID=373386 RepID=A0A2A5QR61_9EURY|nr:hypothetical protein [Natrinema ejinorense]PCR89302.1 hypothetical protein CP557_01375 [Natrinema ejinorense]